MHISYSSIFKVAWQITLKNKFLWLFGFFASFLSLEAVYEVIASQIEQAKNLPALQEKILNLYPSQAEFIDKQIYFLNLLLKDYLAYFVFILLAALFILLIWLVFTSQIYLIKSAAQLYKNQRITNAAIFSQSHNKFWAVLGINVLSKIFLYAGFIALSLPLLFIFLTQNYPANLLAYIFFLFLFTLLAVIIGFLTAYTTNFIILKDLHILEAIRAAWQLFSRNILISLEISFLLFIFKIISLILMLCLILLVGVPLSALLLFAIISNSTLSFVMTLTLIFLAILLIYCLIAAVYTVFYLASWTIAFIQLTEEPLLGKILYYLQSIPSLFKKMAKQHNLEIDKKTLKDESVKLAKKARAETNILAQKLAAKYVELKPKAKKQGKIIAKKLNAAYVEYKPKIEKEIKKFIKQQKKKMASQAKKAAPKKVLKRKITKKNLKYAEKKG